MSSRSRSGLWPSPRVLFSLFIVLAACGGGSDSGGSNYGVNATVSGLQGNSVVLQLNGDPGIAVSKDGSVNLGFLAAGKDYRVTVQTQPTNPTETCAVFNGEGIIGHSDVRDVSVTCSTHAIKVEQLTPAHKSTNAWVRDPIVIRFSSPVDPNSVTADSLRVTASFASGMILERHINPVAGDPNALQIQLGVVPPVPADMTIALTGDIADANGNRLLVPEGGLIWTWQYPVWQAPGGVALQNVDATDDTWWPAVAISDHGDIYVAVPEAMPIPGGTGATVLTLIVKHWNGTAWERLGDPLNVDASEGIVDRPSIAVDPTGKPVVAFNESHGGVATVYVRRWSGSAWDLLGATYLNKEKGTINDPTNNAYWPVLALDASGNPIVTWLETTAGEGSRHNALLRRWNNGWENWIVLNRTSGGDAVYPYVATDSSGRAYVAFKETAATVGAASNLFLTRITWDTESTPTLEPFGSSDKGYVLDTISGVRFQASVAVSHEVAYVGYETGSPTAILAFRCTALASCFSMGGGNLVSDPSHRAGAPSLTVDSSGNPVAAWDEWDIATQTISTFVVKNWNGLSWTLMPGLPIAINPANNTHVPWLASNNGQLVTVWRERTSTNGPYSIFLKRYNQ
jgi:hypothetical protein